MAAPPPPPAVAGGKTCEGKEPGPPIVAPAAAKAGPVGAPAAAGPAAGAISAASAAASLTATISLTTLSSPRKPAVVSRGGRARPPTAIVVSWPVATSTQSVSWLVNSALRTPSTVKASSLSRNWSVSPSGSMAITPAPRS